ncbi:MAG: peptidoglycan DD-metalloendopeptidase family protein [Fibrobacter sp.]|nr:peptidoglycan DD-metalloendopeptidase family protein [Fibrobacter sp.]
MCCSSPVLGAPAKGKPSKEAVEKPKAKSTKEKAEKNVEKKAPAKTKKKKASKAQKPHSNLKQIPDDNTAADELEVDDVAPAKEYISQAPADSTPKKVVITSNDPKGFTKALLYEKEGIDVEIVDVNKLKKEVPKIGFNKDEYFDFSTMLIPVTHEARLGSPYGIRDHRLHRGVDIHVEKGEPMLAAYPGRVSVSKYNKGGYGHYVVVDHEDGLQTLYGHLAERLVRVGDVVFPGDIVGLAGNTGRSSGAHLHFEIRYKDININPATVINFPKWELQPGVERMSKKKIVSAHYNIQNKLKKENFYIVKAGDTLKDVANYFYISEDAVCRINGLKKDQPLRVGQRLKGSK